MGCRRTRTRIVAWLDQELSEREARTVETHLAECPSCQSQATLLKATEPRPSLGPDDVGGEPYFDAMLSGVLSEGDELDADGQAFHRQRWFPAEVRLSAAHAVAYAAVLATALCWAWASHVEAQEAVATTDRLMQSLDHTRVTDAAPPARTYELPVLQTTPLWTTSGPLERPSLTTPATTPMFRTVATTPYRGTF